MTQLYNRKRGLVSIVIATYNYGHFIIDALDGIGRQTYSDIELIVMDDASTDNTEGLINSWHEKHSDRFESFIYLKLPRNCGAGWAYNIGFQISSGEYIVIHDADDVSYRQKIEKQVALLEDHPDTAMVGTGFRTFTDNISESKPGSGWLSFNPVAIERNYKKHFRHCVAYGTLMFRAAMLEEVIGCFKAIPVGNDMFFVNNIVNHDFVVENIKEELHYVRKHTGSMSSLIRHKQDISVLKERKIVDDLVSIVLPIKNSEAFIEKTLKSIGAQTYPNIELIVVDDNSEDRSEEIIKNWYNEYKSHSDSASVMELLYFKPPREVDSPWIYNVGAYLSRGEYIAFHNDKGISHPERIQKQVDFLKQDFMYGAVGTNCEGSDTIIQYDDKIEHYYINENINCVNINTLMVRYEHIHKTAGFNNLMQGAADFEFIYRLLNNGYKVQNLRDVLYSEQGS